MGSVTKPETTEGPVGELIELTETVPESLAGYRVLRRLGGGDVSAVYRAEQIDPERPVALKIVRGGHFMAERNTRLFRREVQRIVRLDHAGIAAIYEIGSIDETLHFFATELVRGFAIDEYARMHKLSEKSRLRLFCAVCDAVCYAHQRGVVHRDLRPQNIQINAKGEVRILDFGLALIADTDVGRTSPYSSPEQGGSDGPNCDASSDIFSLGVILHELLTNRLPTAGNAPQGDGAGGAVSAEQPLRSSSAGGALDADLRAILRKALAENPDRRYECVSIFAEDVRRYLDHHPVLVRTPTTGYKLGKLVKRHKLVVTLGVVWCLLATGLVTTWVLGVRRTMAADRERIDTLSGEMASESQRVAALGTELAAAEQRSAERQNEVVRARAAEQEQRRIAQANLESTEHAAERITDELERGRQATETANQVSATLLGLFKVFEPGPGSSPEVTVDAILDRSAREITEKLRNHPILRSSLMDALGMAYQRVGRPDSSIPLLQKALATRRETLGEQHADTLQTLNNLALLLFAEGQYPEAEPLCRALLERVRRTSGQDSPRTLTAMNNLARLLEAQGKLTEAEPLYRQSLEGRRGVLGEDHPKTLAAMINLATLLEAQGELSEPEALRRRALEGCRSVLGEDNAKTLESMSDLASMLESQGRFSEAEPLYRGAREVGLQALPQDHWLVARAESGLGACLAGQGQHAEAEPLLLNGYAALKAALGENDDSTVRALGRIISLYESWGKAEKAAKYRTRRAAQPAPLLSLPSSD
jgi:tetratricopeptide (TPR) repeat protein